MTLSDVKPSSPLSRYDEHAQSAAPPNVELQKVPRIVRRSSCRRRYRAAKPQFADIQSVHKCVDHPNRHIHRHIVRWQQRCLTTILTLNVAHEKGRIVVDAACLADSPQFSHSL
jgi:hypothetical protein